MYFIYEYMIIQLLVNVLVIYIQMYNYFNFFSNMFGFIFNVFVKIKDQFIFLKKVRELDQDNWQVWDILEKKKNQECLLRDIRNIVFIIRIFKNGI